MRRTKLLKTVTLEKLMDLKIDFAFKQLFGIEKNKAITIVFLNAILQRTGNDKIVDIKFENIEVGGEYEDDKQSRLDLLVVTDSNEWINVEMQFNNQYDMVKRSVYYWAEIYGTPFEKGMSYKKLSLVIAINILNFDLFDQTDRFHTTYHLYEDTEKFKLTDVMEFHFIEMTKLIRDWQADKLDPWNDLLARWLLLLGIVDQRKGKVYDDIFKELEAIAMEDDKLHEAIGNWDTLSNTKEQMAAYRSRVKRIFDEESAILEAELRVVEGVERGREEGRKEGIQEGREEGINLQNREIVLNMHAENLPVESIAQLTKIPREKVREIIDTIPK